jgi:hypothetical protein
LQIGWQAIASLERGCKHWENQTMLDGLGRNRIVGGLLTLLIALTIVLSPHVVDTAHGQRDALQPVAFLPIVIGPSLPDWLDYVNFYRTMANLPAVSENQAWSHGNDLHGRYSVKNDILIHDEDPGNPWYTPEGQAAARASNLAGHYAVDATYQYAIDSWMQAPFHAVGILDPELYQVGYGDYREADGGLQMGAGLDVIRGLGSLPPSIVFPVIWPADGETVPLTLHWGEYPSPLTSCPGYSDPSGLPIILQIGQGGLTPNVTAHGFSENGTPLQHCVFDETSYSNPDSTQQSLGRAILDSRDAIVLIPRSQLTPGSSYDVTITANGQTYNWTFTVSQPLPALDLPGTKLPPSFD